MQSTFNPKTFFHPRKARKALKKLVPYMSSVSHSAGEGS
jgi:hypothetical protein